MLKKLFFKLLPYDADADADAVLLSIVEPLQRIKDNLQAHIKVLKAQQEAYLDTIDDHLDKVEILEGKVETSANAIASAERAKAKFSVLL